MAASPRSLHRAVPGLVLLMGLVLWTACVAMLHRGHTGDLVDDGLFLVSAQALGSGQGFILPSRPGEPPQVRYPIGYPALVAAALAVMPGEPSLRRDAAIARGVVVASGWVFFLASYLWLRRWRVRPWPAVLIVLATAFNRFALASGIVAVSDMPFQAVAACLMARWAAPQAQRVAPTRSLVDGALAAGSFLLRGNGVTLALGALIASALRRPRILALGAGLLGLALVLLPATAYKSRYRSDEPGDYAVSLKVGYSSPAAARNVVAVNLTRMGIELPLIVAPGLAFLAPVARAFEAVPWAVWPIRAAIGLIILIGLVRAAGRRLPGRWPIAAHVGATFGLFLLWPWPFADRYVLGLFPMFLWLFADGISTCARRLGARPRLAHRLGVAALILVLIGTSAVTARLVWTCRSQGGLWGDAVQRASVEASLAYLRDHTEPDAVVVTMWPELVYLHAGRQALPLVEVEDWLRGQPSPPPRLVARMATAAQRPAYVLYAPSGPAIDALQVETLRRDADFEIRPLFRSPTGDHAVASIRLQTSHP